MNVFTAGVCLPAALLKIGDSTRAENEIAALFCEFPLLRSLFSWAKAVTPSFETKAQRDEYIAKMATRGGVTAAVVESLDAGEPLSAAMRRGIARSEALSEQALHAAFQ